MELDAGTVGWSAGGDELATKRESWRSTIELNVCHAERQGVLRRVRRTVDDRDYRYRLLSRDQR